MHTMHSRRMLHLVDHRALGMNDTTTADHASNDFILHVAKINYLTLSAATYVAQRCRIMLIHTRNTKNLADSPICKY